MRGQALSNTRKLNRHWQSGGNGGPRPDLWKKTVLVDRSERVRVTFPIPLSAIPDNEILLLYIYFEGYSNLKQSIVLDYPSLITQSLTLTSTIPYNRHYGDNLSATALIAPGDSEFSLYYSNGGSLSQAPRAAYITFGIKRFQRSNGMNLVNTETLGYTFNSNTSYTFTTTEDISTCDYVMITLKNAIIGGYGRNGQSFLFPVTPNNLNVITQHAGIEVPSASLGDYTVADFEVVDAHHIKVTVQEIGEPGTTPYNLYVILDLFKENTTI